MLVPPPGGEQPLVQPIAGVSERLFAAQTLTGAKAIEGNGEELDADE
jgi:hypothetical protein